MTKNSTDQTAIALVQKFRHLRVLIIGDAMLDTYIEGRAERLCSEGPVPIVRKTTEEHIPGGAANSAANLAALGADVRFIGVIGQDLAGSLLRTELEARSISTRWLVEDTQTQTQQKRRILADGQYLVRLDDGHTRTTHSDQRQTTAVYAAQTRQQIASYLDELYRESDVVVVSDYCYGVISAPLIEQLGRLQRADPRPLLVDSKALLRFKDVPITVVTPNYREAQTLQGWAEESNGENANYLEEVTIVARQLQQQIQAEHIAITLAQDGVLLLDQENHVEHLPAHPVKQVNDVGAGDSFTAALALGLGATDSIREAALIALDAAGIAVTKVRTASVQYQELLQRVSLRTYTAQIHQEANGTQETLSRLAAQLEIERLLGKTVIFTNGVFDILHAGHVQFLRQARELGDVLVVAINSDQSARKLKGVGRPINNERDRLALVEALGMVDYALLFDEDTPTELIYRLRPAIHVKGGDYAESVLPEADAVREVGGQVVILALVGSMSTSSVIQRIIALTSERN